jgi:hypothetical protein
MITLLQPKPGGWLLLVGPPSKNSTVLSAIVQLTKKGPLRVLDCAGYFEANISAQAKAHHGEASRKEITIKRVATCEQVFDALTGMRPTATEFVILDLLQPFFTRQGDFPDYKKVLKACISHLDRLAKKANGIVTVSPPIVPTSATLELLALLSASSNGNLSADPLGNGYGFPTSSRADNPLGDLSLF